MTQLNLNVIKFLYRSKRIQTDMYESGRMTKTAAMPMYGENVNIFLYETAELIAL